MAGLYGRLIKAWERTQVELHGTYSTDRVLALAQYTQETSWAHIIMVLLVTPLPCLTITVLSDVLPLADPSEGVNANKMFQVRQFYTFVIISFLCAQQFRTSVRALPYPNWRVVRNSVIVALLTVAVLYGLTLWIGFPVPFSIIVAIPSWVVFITISMAIEWLRLIRQNPGTAIMVLNTVKVLMCEVLLVVIYPPYFYTFTTLSKTGQMFFAALLPVIKLVMRNIFTMTVVHLSDEMPEVVVFNSEVFNALFVSYCMPSSPSFGTTLMVTAALLVQLSMSLRDVNIAVHRTELVGRHIAAEHGDPCQIIAKSSAAGGRKLSTLERANTLLRGGAIQLETQQMSKIHVKSSNLDVKDVDSSRSTRQLQPVGGRIHPEPDPIKAELVKPKRASQEMSAVSAQYVLEVRRLMYLTEFLVLIYYVGVFIPRIFSIYMGAMYALPNRCYYAQLADLTEPELEKALINVMFNCGLTFISLVLLCAVLHRRLGFSAIRQLAFVLDKQWPGVQIKICFWVFYNVQASLQHHGFDYTFKFAWLNGNLTNNSTSAIDND